jgi:hypothetical protein
MNHEEKNKPVFFLLKLAISLDGVKPSPNCIVARPITIAQLKMEVACILCKVIEIQS